MRRDGGNSAARPRTWAAAWWETAAGEDPLPRHSAQLRFLSALAGFPGHSRCRAAVGGSTGPWAASPRATPGPPARRASYAGASIFCGHALLRTIGSLPSSIEWVPLPELTHTHTHTHTHAAPRCPPAPAPGNPPTELQGCAPSRVLRKSQLTPGAARSGPGKPPATGENSLSAVKPRSSNTPGEPETPARRGGLKLADKGPIFSLLKTQPNV